MAKSSLPERGGSTCLLISTSTYSVRLGLIQDRDVGVGVFPERKKTRRHITSDSMRLRHLNAEDVPMRGEAREGVDGRIPARKSTISRNNKTSSQSRCGSIY
jgi:hypothetical protein